MFVKEYKEINLNDMSCVLSYLKIDRLNIFCVDNIKGINKTIIEDKSQILLIELGVEEFIQFLNNPNENFMDYNKNSLYIIRNSCYIDVKLLFNKINNCNVNLGRGGGQKNHMVSPMEIRFFAYIMAMFNFKYPDVCYFNNFNDINKNRYLPFYSNKK